MDGARFRPSADARVGSPASRESDARVRAFLADHGRVITTAEAVQLGVDANGLRALVRRGVLTRIVRGGYACRETYDEPGVTQRSRRHRLAVIAVLRSHSGTLSASHQSAAVLMGLPVLGHDLDRVHVVHSRPTRDTCRHSRFTVHCFPGADGLGEVGGVPSVVPALAVLGTAVSTGLRSGIAVADAALRAELTTMSELTIWLERMRHTPGLAAARRVVRLASSTAESPGESLARMVLIDLGYRVVPQFTIVEEDGQFIARVDFYLPDLGVVVEFDGQVKYAGADGREALVREKRREDAIRRRGFGVVRLVWADLVNPSRVRVLIEQAARNSGWGLSSALAGRKCS